MSADMLQWLAIALVVVAMIAAFGAISARSLFVTAMHLVAAGVTIAVIVLLLAGGESALTTALFGGAWAPVLLLGAMLLSVRAAKPAHPGATLLGWLGAAGAAPFVWWPLGELSVRAPTASVATMGVGFWLAPLLVVVAIVCLALLGYGERGALNSRTRS